MSITIKLSDTHTCIFGCGGRLQARHCRPASKHHCSCHSSCMRCVQLCQQQLYRVCFETCTLGNSDNTTHCSLQKSPSCACAVIYKKYGGKLTLVKVVGCLVYPDVLPAVCNNQQKFIMLQNSLSVIPMYMACMSHIHQKHWNRIFQSAKAVVPEWTSVHRRAAAMSASQT